MYHEIPFNVPAIPIRPQGVYRICTLCNSTERGGWWSLLSQPLHHAIVVVDIEKFGDTRRGDLHRSAVRDGLFEALEQAFNEAGIDWPDCEVQTRGDGALILVPARFPERQLVDQVPTRLAAGVRRHNAKFAAEGKMRLRVAFHSGPVEVVANGSADATVIFACRLVDSDVAREAQRTSDGPITIIVSDSFYENTVRNEPAAEPEAYQRVALRVKERHTIAWIRSQARRHSPTLRSAVEGIPSNHRRPTEADELVDILVAVPALRREGARARLLGLLPNGISLAMPHELDLWPYARNLARLCAEHAGGLDALADALTTLTDDARPARQLEALRHRRAVEEPADRLCSALAALPCLGDPMTSELVVRRLREALNEDLVVGERPDPHALAVRLTSVCSGNTDRLLLLLEVVSLFEPENSPLTELRGIVDELTRAERPADVFTIEHRTGLLTLLTGEVIPNIADIYHTAGGPAAPDLGKHTTYPRILRALESLNARSDGLPRLLAFVEHVAARVDSELKTKLRQWTKTIATEMGLDEELAALREEVRKELNAADSTLASKLIAYLVVKLEREGPTGEHFRLANWRQLGNPSRWAPERGQDRTGSLGRTKNHVASLIERIEADWGDRQPDIRIEFVLDMPDLGVLDVDQWPWENAPHSEPVGCRYPVVVRSAERMRARHYHRDWHRRWKELSGQLSHVGHVEPHSALRGYGTDDRSLRRLQAALSRRSDIVALVLTAPPLAEYQGHDEMSIGVKAGVPLIWLHREDCGSREFTSTVEQLMHDNDPDHLLERVRHARLAAYAKAQDEQHVGSALTVLYDDPDRLVTPHRPEHPSAEGTVR
ncbi:VMAP-C domain-containing protein [Lentzea sp. NPDC004789]